jgi:ribosomal protein S18 acetylase RimI-like enzyme
VNVRAAGLADVTTLVPLHREAFKGTIGDALGARYARAFLAWFITAPRGIALVAEEAGAIIGYVLGAPDGYGPQLTRDLLPAIAWGALANAPRVAKHPSFRRQVRARIAHLLLRREPTHDVARATPSGSMCLVAIGTASLARGRGVGRALVQAFAARTREFSGPTTAVVILDVFRHNAAARALYARSGFTVLAEAGDVVRMALSIKPA